MKKICSLVLSFCLFTGILSQYSVFAYGVPSDWAAEEVEEAVSNQLVPYSVKRDYKAYITREQFCEMVVLAYEALSGETAAVGEEEFYDTDSDEVKKAANLNIVEGYGNGIFGPNDLITREQIAVMVVRMLDCAVPSVDIYDYSSHYYADKYEISDWAMPSVNFAYENDIMQGIGDYKIAPKLNTTCEQAVLLIYRTYAQYISYDDGYDDIKYINDDMYYTEPDDECIDTENEITFVDNEVIIHAKKGTAKSKIEDIISEYDGEIVGEIALTDTYQIRFYDSYYYDGITEIIDEFCKNSCIDSASPNFITEQSVCYTPNDAEWADDWEDENPDGLNWGVEAINAPQAWDYRNKMKDVNVGIIDNCFWEHEDIEYKETLFNYPETVKKDDFHGTHIAGIIGAKFNNNLGISGVCPKANLYCTSISSNPKWSNSSSTMSYYTALTYLIAMKKCKAINISLGYTNEQNYAVQYNSSWRSIHNVYSSKLGQYLKILLNVGNDFVLCVSAGNCNNKIYEKDDSYYGYKYVSSKGHNLGIEAEYNSGFCGIEDKEIKDRIIVVGACGNNGNGQYEYSAFSNVGSRVDVVAPGEEIYSTIDNNEYEKHKGTSQAAPHVTGLAAMLFSIDNTLTGKEVKKLIVDTANTNVSGTEKKMINAGAAVKKLLGEKDNTSKTEETPKENTDYSIKNTDYNSNTMGVDNFIAHDEKYYYYKGVNGSLTKEAKNGSGIEEIYTDEFRYICAIDSSYIYVLKNNGDVNKLIRVSKDSSDSITLLSDVYDIHWQDNRYLYLTLKDDDTAIFKYNRRELQIEEFTSFDYPVVKVVNYESLDSGKYYVITYKHDFLSSLLDEPSNYYYIIDKDGNILKDCGNASLIEDYHMWKYPNYTSYEKIVVKGHGKPRQSGDVYWSNGSISNAKRINSASGWKFSDYGIISMKKTGSSYSVVLNTAEDCSEIELLSDNDKLDYRRLAFGDNKKFYFIDVTDDTYIVSEKKIGSELSTLLSTFDNSTDLEDIMLQIMGDWIMVFSNDDNHEAQLLHRLTKEGSIKQILLK